MAHNINTYIGRQAAWHGLGTVTGSYMTWSDILTNGGLDFQVIKNQLEYQGAPVEAWGTFRSDNGVMLGTVGKDFEVVQHTLGFEFLDQLVGNKNGAHYETAGVLGKGEQVWGLIDLNVTISVRGDITKGYLLFATGHDGSMSWLNKMVFTRVVCANTLAVAMGERSKAEFRIRHTKNANKRIVDAHKALIMIESDMKTVEERLNFLAGRKVTREVVTGVFDRLFPKREKADGTPVDTTRRQNVLDSILMNFELNDRNAFPEQRGSAYNLLNSITEYVDHDRSSRGDNREQSAMFGSGDALKTKAYEYILEGAKGLDALPSPGFHYTAVPTPLVTPAVVNPVGTETPNLDAVLAAMGVN